MDKLFDITTHELRNFVHYYTSVHYYTNDQLITSAKLQREIFGAPTGVPRISLRSADQPFTNRGNLTGFTRDFKIQR